MIEKNGEGVLGFITNHGYLDNPTFLDMRNHLRKTFDRIYVLDLHGNAKKKEVSPDGSPDKNVFDIQQGVAVIIAVKRKESAKKTKPLAEVRHGDLWGARENKYASLWAGTQASLMCIDATPQESPWRFIPSGGKLEETYLAGFAVSQLCNQLGKPTPGFATQHDDFAISWNAANAVEKVEKFLSAATEDDARQLFHLCAQDQWRYHRAMQELATGEWREEMTPVCYRPFDRRWTVFNRNVAVHRRERVSRHLFRTPNFAFCLSGNSGAIGSPAFDAVGIADCVTELNFFRRGGAYIFPIYLYPIDQDFDQSIRLNFDPKLYTKIREAAGLTGPSPAPDGTDAFRRASGDARPHEVQVFDYIYGVLHCPAYRETYAEFLKIDFPRVPFPHSPESFRAISEQGEALRRLHLMEPAAIGDTPFPFEGEGDSVVDKPRHEAGKVWVNKDQGFARVSATAWNFHIGGYQPAQKWLKDRKGRALSWDDVRHYQRIIKILDETHRIMQLIEVPLD